jgi:hypothetical protein
MRAGRIGFRSSKTFVSFFVRFPALLLLCGGLCSDDSYASEPGSDTTGIGQLVKPGEVPVGMEQSFTIKMKSIYLIAPVSHNVHEDDVRIGTQSTG